MNIPHGEIKEVDARNISHIESNPNKIETVFQKGEIFITHSEEGKVLMSKSMKEFLGVTDDEQRIIDYAMRKAGVEGYVLVGEKDKVGNYPQYFIDILNFLPGVDKTSEITVDRLLDPNGKDYGRDLRELLFLKIDTPISPEVQNETRTIKQMFEQVLSDLGLTK